MTRDNSSIWIAMADIFLCILAVVIVCVNPVAKNDHAVELQAQYLVTITWSVDVDADADNWLKTPRGTVFYNPEHRQVGCVTLDTDNRGFEDSQFTMADGTAQKLAESKEVITLRCLEPGHYTQAVNLYAYHVDNVVQTGANLGLKVHVEIVAINPTVHPVFAKDVTLDYVKQTTNVVSFDIDQAGKLTLSEPPLTPISDEFYHPSGGQQ